MESRLDTPSEKERRAFAQEWHRELRQEIRVAQDRREVILRWSLPIVFATVASSAASDAPVASSALWHWLAAGVVLLVAVETTHRLTGDIIYAAARNERLENFDQSLPPFERSVHEPAADHYAELRLPSWLKKYWPRRGRSTLLSAWYGLTAIGVIGYWLVGISHASLGQTLAALAMPMIALLGCCRLLLSGRLHWRRDQLIAGDLVFRWLESENPD
jgi:hypothetical protein